MRDGSVTAARPSVPPAFHAVDDLGPARLVASVPRSRRAGFSIGMLLGWGVSIFIAGALVALIASIFLESESSPPMRIGPLLVEPEDLVILAVAVVVWVAGLLVVAHWLRRKGAQVIVLYEQGIAVSDGRSVRRWRWEDILGVQRRPIVHEVKPGLPTDVGGLLTAAGVLAVLAAFKLTKRPTVRVETHYWFFDRQGGAFSLDRWLPAVDDLARDIERQVIDRLAPVARGTLASGGAVQFGQITLTANALTVADLTIPISDVERVEVEKDALHVMAAGSRRATVPVAGVANLTLLQELLEERPSAQAG